MGVSLVLTGEIIEGRTHLDQSVALYDPAENPLVATYLGAHQTAGLSARSLTLWLLAIPRPRLQMQIKRSVIRARSTELPHW